MTYSSCSVRVYIDSQKKIWSAEFIREFRYFVNCELVNINPSDCNLFFRVAKTATGWKIDGRPMTSGVVKDMFVSKGLA